MKKILSFLLFLVLLPCAVHATLGGATVSPLGVATEPNDATFSYGAISGVGAADTSAAVKLNGYAGVQFKIQKVNYRGALKLQGSHDNSTWETILQDDTDAAGVTETMYWQSFSGWNYARAVADPNGSNAGTATITGKLISTENTKVLRYSGYWGPNADPKEIRASAALTTGTSDAYFKTKGRGMQLNVNISARSSGALTVTVYSVSPTGAKNSVLDSGGLTATGTKSLIITPDLVAAANSTAVGVGNSWYVYFNETGTSDTFSADVVPLP